MGKYYLSADLEGVTGVTSLPQCYPTGDRTGYNRAVAQLVMEVNWVITQIRHHDPQAQFVVNDAHNTMTNLPWASLPPDVSFVGGKPKPCAMVAGLDESFDGAFFVGYHAMAGTLNGNLAHTFHTKIQTVHINNVPLGEGGVNALYAQEACGVPTLLVSGDQALCHEMTRLLPHLATVETKQGLSLTAAQCHPWDHVQARYTQAIEGLGLADPRAAKAKAQKHAMAISAPFHLQIQFVDALCADIVSVSPLYTRVDSVTVGFTADTMETVYRALQSAYMMLAYARCLDD